MHKWKMPCSRWLHKFRCDLKLKNKLIFSFSTLVVLPILFTGLCAYFIYQRDMENAEKNSLFNSMKQLNNSIDFFYEVYMNKSIMVIGNSSLIEVLTQTNRNLVDEIGAMYRIDSILSQLTNDIKHSFLKNSYYFGGQLKVEIYVKNPAISSGQTTIMPFRRIENEEWCRELYRSDRMLQWQNGIVKEGETAYIVLNQKLVDIGNADGIGVLRLMIPIRRLESVIEKNIHNHTVGLFYADANFGRILEYGDFNNRGYLEKIQKMKLSEGVNDIVLDRKNYIAGFIQSEITGWRLIYLVPKKLITDKTRKIAAITLGTVLVSILTCVMIATTISYFVTKRMNVLLEKTNRIKGDNLWVDVTIEGEDEIGQLDRNFNKMIYRLQELIEKEYKAKLIVNLTKLELLQEQINPHLLYNTLSMIKLTAKRSGQTDILNIANNLVNFYKGFLNEGKITSSLQAEVDMVKRYIEIAELVYEIDIKSTFLIDREALQYYSIKLFLQPIVENSILHGLRPRKQGTLVISSRVTEDTVEFIVSDDGTGMLQETVDELNESLSAVQDGKGYGLSNVAKRIRLFFEGRGGVKIESTAGEGTTVVVTLPKLTREQINQLLEEKNY